MTATRSTKGRVIVLGIMVFYPLAGVRFQFLHYLRGLRRLGYDVYYFEDTLYTVYDPDLNNYTTDATGNIARLARYMESVGFGDRWAFRDNDGRVHGMSAPALTAVVRTADALLNVTGGQGIKDDLLRVPRRAYVESDPFAQQVRVASGDEKTIAFLDCHTHHFSFGENLGQPGCTAPIVRYSWQPTRQPVDLDLWACHGPPPGAAYTTVTTWKNKNPGVVWQGEHYAWTKDIEFRKFLDLPTRRPCPFELATSVDDDVRAELLARKWRLADSFAVSLEADDYRRYIQRSRAEFTVARDQYSRPRTGWFSDRSVCYLAAGRPVITQETGFSRTVPAGRGLFAYESMDQILAAVDAIESDYDAHSAAARDIAAAYFSTDVVLPSLMARIGL